MVAFVIWLLAGVAFIILGLCSFFSKKAKAFGFWSNVGMFPVEDIRKYNRAIGKLWISFGIIFIILGIPLLDGQNSPLVIISMIGSMLEAIVTMAVYTMVIEKKYRKK